MSARHRRRSRRGFWRREPDIPHRLDDIAARRERLIAALHARGVVATPYASRGVLVSHRISGARMLISVRFFPPWGRPAWCVVRADRLDSIGGLTEYDQVADRIAAVLSRG